ncbi:MAG: HAD family hydrolase [Luteolibacter sp.]|jgi:FMN phosphatase YigB (HAD superfamily)|nr:HAD family hydrolase [Luteolibacter sp.]
MKVAIVHYHLGHGGVSKVIAAHSRLMGGHGIPHVILAGPSQEDPPAGLPVRIVGGLAYSSTVGDPTVLLNELRAAACEALGQAPDIWHFHNHSLGKNPQVPEVVALLAAENERLLLQIHDLAEDGRPENYRMIAECRKLYPISPRVRYAFMNLRDMGIFTGAGLPVEHADVLVNPIPLVAGNQPVDSRDPIIFAPVRGIRRKNLGELVFLAALAPEGARFAVSRAPSNPAALPVHDAWRRFAKQHRLPIGFDVVDRFSPDCGASADFESWVAHSTHLVTTSVAEGFGLPFLEAIALGKPLIGRNLPHIAAEHARHGIRPGNLYYRILIPAEWVDLVILREHLTTTLERDFRIYRRPLTREIITATFEALMHDGWLDFGNLSEPLQQGVIERLADPASRTVPLVKTGGLAEPAEAWLAVAISNRTPTATPAQLAPYAPAEYAKTITAAYSHLAGRPSAPVRFLPASEILTSFLAPRSFHFLLSALKPDDIPLSPYRAVVFDIYGTLLLAAPGGVKPDPAADPVLREILVRHGHPAPESPSTALHAAVIRHHAAAATAFPEIDLRVLWRELLSLDPGADLGSLVEELESAWHPAQPMPGAQNFIRHLARSGVSLGLLSNAQFNTLRSLGSIADLFPPELTILSYQHGIAKPSPALFEMLADRLAGRGISPAETLFIGNDPLQDIVPAAALGFKTALFAGHPDSFRPGECVPDFVIRNWVLAGSSKMHGE